MNRRLFALAPLVGLGLAGVASAQGGGPRLNEIQVVGTHNSYHLAPGPEVMALIASGGKARAEGLDYTHRPLAEQFSRLKIRQVELDVFADPAGGLFAEPAARAILKAAGKDPGPDPDEGGKLRKPGFKVLHVQDVDYRTTVATLAEALAQVRDWSAAHPRHVPILVLVEVKDGAIPSLPTRPRPIGRAELDALDAEIRAAFDAPTILTPDDVRGDSPTLPGAIRSRGWPTLDACRGRVLFALDNEGRVRDLYLEGHPALRGRAMFATVAPTDPAAAWMKVNDPVADFETIRRLVHDGFLVRTRADADTAEARRDDPSRREKALASGAQYISTDYPEPRPEFSGYRVALPGGVAARADPVNGDPSRAGPDPEGPTAPAGRP